MNRFALADESGSSLVVRLRRCLVVPDDLMRGSHRFVS